MNLNSFTDEDFITIFKLVEGLDVDFEKIRKYDGQKYNLIITGNIGVGKSTICQIIYTTLKSYLVNVTPYPEYIKTELGPKMLSLRMTNQISPMTFQSYVLDVWEQLFKNNEYKTKKSFNILERTPIESVECFAKNSNITSWDYESLLRRCVEINVNNNFPDHSDCSVQVVRNDDLKKSVTEIFKLIITDLERGVTDRLIGLRTDIETNIRRIIKRDRISEQKINLNTYEQYYEELYSTFYN